MRPICALIAIVTLAVPACTVGPSLATFPPAQSPSGIVVDLRTEARRIEGELLAIRDTAYVVLEGGRMTLVRYSLVRNAVFPHDIVDWDAGVRTPPPHARERLRLLSRFPQGLSPELERRMLDALGQPAIEVIP